MVVKILAGIKSAVPEWRIVKSSSFYFCCIGFVVVQLSPEFALVKLDRVVNLMEPRGTRAGLDRVVHLMEPGNEAGQLPPKGDLLSWLH